MAISISEDRRIETVHDRAMIFELTSRYAHALDRKELDTLALCFAPDAHASYQGVAVGPGPEKIVAHLVTHIAKAKRSTHLVGNHNLTIHGESASLELYATSHMLFPGPNGDYVRNRGLLYMEELVKRRGRWLIHTIVHNVLWERNEPV